MAILVLGVAGTAMLLRFRAELRRTVDEALIDQATSLSTDPATAIASMRGTEGLFAQLLDGGGTRVLATSAGLGEEPLPVLESIGREDAAFFDAEVRTSEEEVPARLYALRLEDDSTLVVGQDVEDQREALARLTTIVAVGGPVLLVAITLLGWIIAGAALRPVERLRTEAAAISTTEPDRRLPVPRTGDELQRLAETLNSMLDRLHEALDRERRFVDEASHELRTPLGVLSAEVDLARKESRSRDELVEALGSIAGETERLRRLTEDLLVLARSDRGRLPVHRAEVDVSEVVGRVVSGAVERADRAGVRLHGEGGDVRARVDADRLRQALDNLVDNAIRHAGRGGDVGVRADREDGRLRVIVRDSGPGFAPDVLERAFEPFTRSASEHDDDGAGLGLAIVRAVAEAHGGSATARNLDGGGAVVSLDLPI
jgi:heavy metal sensor kinase